MTELLRRPFAPLSVPNYRRFFLGQLISLTGTWVQIVAELWLVLQLTGSGLSLGLTTALQFAPMLVVTPWAGLLADRLPKRRILLATQAAMVVPALALLTLTAAGAVELWMVYALVFARGVGNAVDHPVRQAFVVELVGPARVASAVSLNAALFAAARMAGPALGGSLIATVGLAPCFALNALSFLPVLWVLHRLDPSALRPAEPAARARGQLRSALRYVRATPELRVPLAVMAVVGTFAFNFAVLLPLMARYAFDAGAAGYGALGGAMGAGAVAGALATAGRRDPAPRDQGLLALAFGALIAALAVAPSLPVAMAVLVPVGATSMAFAATTNALLQLAVSSGMRGRVMALYTVVFLGTTPIGGPLVGWIAEQAGPRAGLGVGAAATIAAGLGGLAATGTLRAWRSTRSSTGTAGASATCASRSRTAAISAASTACPPTASPGSRAKRS